MTERKNKMEEKRFLVQAILMDGNSERVINSTKTDNAVETMHAFMKMHRNSRQYKYNVMTIKTQFVQTFENIFQ